MANLKRLGLLFFILAVDLSFGSDHHARSSFILKPGDEGVHALKITTAEGELVSCAFRFSTKRRNSQEDEEKELSSSVRRPSVQGILGRLSGICIRKTIDYWKYELCFEGEIKQVHGQIHHNMGRYAGLEGSLQLYDEGTPCEARSEKKGRKTKVEFLCDRQLRIRSVEEVSTCSYLVIVGTPIVCGTGDFGIAPADDETDASLQIQDEQWMLEVNQVGKGRVDCNARALTGDIRAKPERPALTTLEFARFDLELSLSSDSPTTLLNDMHVVRGPDRARLSISEREYSLHVNAIVGERKVQVKSGDSFSGQLEFAQVLCRIVDR
jgi:hypothetical protein